VGEYTIKFDYAGQTYTWDDSSLQRQYTGTVFSPASETQSLTVTSDPLPDPITSYPLPEEYWTRPIDGQNPAWYTITSHWLSGNYLGSHQVFQGFESTRLCPHRTCPGGSCHHFLSQGLPEASLRSPR